MALSGNTGYTPIPNNSAATTGLFDRRYQALQDNITSLWTSTNSIQQGNFSTNTLSPASGNTVSLTTAALVARSIDSGGQVYNVAAFGLVDDGVTDNSPLLYTLCSTISQIAKRRLYFPALNTGTYKFLSTVTLLNRGYEFVGDHEERPTQGGGVRFAFAPSASTYYRPLISIGTSKVTGNPLYDITYANGDYDGLQGTWFEGINFAYTGSSLKSLNNGLGSYGSGAIAVQDWRGGDTRFKNCWFEQFDYGFWGLQSDFDVMENVTALACKTGFYFGPRSDQLRTINVQANSCDQGVWLDRCAGSVHVGLNLIDSGSSITEVGLRLGSQYTDAGCEGHVFLNPWFEIGASSSATNIEALMEVSGATDTQITRDVTIVRPVILTSAQNVNPHSVYLARFGNATRIKFDGFTNQLSNLSKTFKFQHASAAAHVQVITHDDLVPSYVTSGAGVPVVSLYHTGYGAHTFEGSNGRLAVNYSTQTSGYANNWFAGSESQLGFFVQFPNRDATGNANNILSITRRVQHKSAPPTTGTWSVGDTVINTAPSLGTWWGQVCITAGTPGTWQPFGNTSIRTTSASLTSLNVAVEEAVFSFGASGASFAVRSGGTLWIFSSSLSTKG